MVLIGAVSCGEKLASHGGRLDPDRDQCRAADRRRRGRPSRRALARACKRRVRSASRWPDSIAVAFAGSQKTLMVGAYVALAVGPLAILPMVAYHAVQLFVDTLIADRWAQAEIRRHGVSS